MSHHIHDAAVHEWLGRLAMHTAITQKQLPPAERRLADRTLQEFLESDAPTPELRDMIRREVKR